MQYFTFFPLLSFILTASALSIDYSHRRIAVRQEDRQEASSLPEPPSPPTGTIPSVIRSPGDTPPVEGAPALPATFVYDQSQWPAINAVPPADSPQVQAWLRELEGHDIPAFNATLKGSCEADPAAAKEAEARGWWTCGGPTRDTDITICPEKGTWGLTFDDGPAEHTPKLLDHLKQKNIHATFFVVGSRVVEHPATLLDEYMQGHEISIHTWSHSPLTSLSTAQIVAELGWTRHAIWSVLGVSPTTMRPPYGDIDDRVRAISMAMGMIPVMWTRTPSGVTFDTNDWRVNNGETSVEQSVQTFDDILTKGSPELDSGFIVLQHDLYEVTVGMAINKTLNLAATRQPPFKLESIGQCQKWDPKEFYRETSENAPFPFPPANKTIDVDGDGKPDNA